MQSLRRVLKATAFLYPEVGYCQVSFEFYPITVKTFIEANFTLILILLLYFVYWKLVFVIIFKKYMKNKPKGIALGNGCSCRILAISVCRRKRVLGNF